MPYRLFYEFRNTVIDLAVENTKSTMQSKPFSSLITGTLASIILTALDSRKAEGRPSFGMMDRPNC